MNSEKFFQLSQKMSNNYLEILDLVPNSKHLGYLSESALIFASFVAFVNDEINESQEYENDK